MPGHPQSKAAHFEKQEGAPKQQLHLFLKKYFKFFEIQIFKKNRKF
jgi:hypothetical protein